jgi:hypothetical protein
MTGLDPRDTRGLEGLLGKVRNMKGAPIDRPRAERTQRFRVISAKNAAPGSIHAEESIARSEQGQQYADRRSRTKLVRRIHELTIGASNGERRSIQVQHVRDLRGATSHTAGTSTQ